MKSKLRWVVLCAFLLSSCTSLNQVDQIKADELINRSDVNNTVTVMAPEEWNSFNFEDGVSLDVLLKADHPVIIHDHNIKVFMRLNEDWVLVENQELYPENTFIIEPSGPKAFRSAEIILFPRLDQKSASLILRIFVFGNLYDDNVEGNEVLAYVDVTLRR